jgi:hypothetical protein
VDGLVGIAVVTIADHLVVDAAPQHDVARDDHIYCRRPSYQQRLERSRHGACVESLAHYLLAGGQAQRQRGERRFREIALALRREDIVHAEIAHAPVGGLGGSEGQRARLAAHRFDQFVHAGDGFGVVGERDARWRVQTLRCVEGDGQAVGSANLIPVGRLPGEELARLIRRDTIDWDAQVSKKRERAGAKIDAGVALRRGAIRQ